MVWFLSLSGRQTRCDRETSQVLVHCDDRRRRAFVPHVRARATGADGYFPCGTEHRIGVGCGQRLTHPVDRSACPCSGLGARGATARARSESFGSRCLAGLLESGHRLRARSECFAVAPQQEPGQRTEPGEESLPWRQNSGDTILASGPVHARREDRILLLQIELLRLLSHEFVRGAAAAAAGEYAECSIAM